MSGETRPASRAPEPVPFGALRLALLAEPRPARPLGLLVLAHGAGGSPTHPRMRARAAALAEAGVAVWRFAFPYRADPAHARRPPDRLPVLVESYRAVVRDLRARGACAGLRVLLGGHSLGGRVASVLASEGEPCDGLVLLSYPLHPARRPERARVAHLDAVAAPVFCAQGTRDPLCERALLERTLATLARPWCVEWIEGADHELRLSAARERALAAESGSERELPPGHAPERGPAHELALVLAARAAARWASALPAPGGTTR